MRQELRWCHPLVGTRVLKMLRSLDFLNSMKTFLALIAAIATILLLKHFFFSEYVVNSGNKYGFTIGMTKNQAIVQISQEYTSSGLQIVLSPSSANNSSEDVIYTDPIQIDAAVADSKNIWQLRFKGSEKNVLLLRFSGDKLEEMVRYRRAFIP
jgi:hypothetical protein